MKTTHIIALFALAILSIGIASALTINTVTISDMHPGEEATLKVELKNTLNTSVEDVSLALDFTNLPFSAVSGSEDGVSQIDSDDEQTLSYRIKASNEAKAGDYSIPYTLTYKGLTAPRKGTISVTVLASPDLSFSAELDNPVVGAKTKLTLRIVNKGLGDARFVSLDLNPSGYTQLSSQSNYIGTIASDDSETVSFDVITTSSNPAISGVITYKDIENKEITLPISVPIKAYSQERALELGITKKSNAPMYISIIIILAVIWFIWRFFKKRRKMKNLAR